MKARKGRGLFVWLGAKVIKGIAWGVSILSFLLFIVGMSRNDDKSAIFLAVSIVIWLVLGS